MSLTPRPPTLIFLCVSSLSCPQTLHQIQVLFYNLSSELHPTVAKAKVPKVEVSYQATQLGWLPGNWYNFLVAER